MRLQAARREPPAEPHVVLSPRNENNRQDRKSWRGCFKSSWVVGLRALPWFFLQREENVTPETYQKEKFRANIFF